jgi:glycosyltransferase involved in cell wall biosynthesis
MRKEDLYKELASARLLVYPSIFWETSCMAAIEAMACGTPVITSHYCALKETVPHEQAGLLVKGWPRKQREGGVGFWYDEPHTTYQRDYIRAVVQVMREPSLWEKLHQGALRWVEHYDYGIIAAEWNEKLGDLLLTQNHRQSVTACMIVRDGESTLHRCLKSLVGRVDHVRVRVDSRTTDTTRAIARQYTDDVQDFQWPESFGVARNMSIEGVTSDWILWIDADEVLSGEIGRYLRDNCFNAYALAQVHLSPGVPEHRDMPARLFRNRIGVQFYGKIHEQPELVLNEGIPKTFGIPDVIIPHDGYGQFQAVDARWARNHDYMAADLEENPDRDISWFSYMRDCVSATERKLRENGGQMTPELHTLLTQAVHIYDERFVDVNHNWHRYAYPFFQTALRLQGCPEFAFCVAGSVQKIPDGQELKIQKRFFRSQDEARMELNEMLNRVMGGMYPAHPCPFEE